MSMQDELASLQKSIEAGSYNAAPSTLTQGSSLQIEDLSPVMEVTTFQEKSLKLAKSLTKHSSKSTLVQFQRQLDYGTLGGSAQYEGNIGEENTSSYVRAVVPMAFYSTVRRVSVAANMVATFDGQKAEDRSAQDAAKKLAADIEMECFRAGSDFSNAGVFDGNPHALANMPGMHGVDIQVRMSDVQANTKDQMMASFGSDQSVVVPVNGVLTQSVVEDCSSKSAMKHGEADTLYLDILALSAYNKIAHAKERIMLAGSAQDATGANLRKQWTSAGDVSIESSRFLAGRTNSDKPSVNSAAAPTAAGANVVDAASALEVGSYWYEVTAVNESGESYKSAAVSVTIAAGEKAEITIGAVATAKFYRVYRSEVGGSAKSTKFVGNVKISGGASTKFTDLGNRTPGSSTGFLLQKDSLAMHELAPFSTQVLAITNLSLPKAFFQFTTLAARAPQVNVLLENIK